MDLFQIPEEAARLPGKQARTWRDYELRDVVVFFVVHGLAIWGLFLDVGWEVWAVCAALYVVRMFAITGFYHRYFAHRTFKTSRVMQFVMAFIAETACQRGVLWWASHHRHHHKHSDDPQDTHSPTQNGFLYSHVGWIYDDNGVTNYPRVKDLSRYPELVMLNKLWLLPPFVLGLAVTIWAGFGGLCIAFMMSTVLLWHGTFTINSLSHVWGKRVYNTTDTSRNNWVLALITLGEGWHNNHHHFMNSTRQGFRWWEIDITYYTLKMMSWVGLVWDLKEPPAHVVQRTAEFLAQEAKATETVRPAA